MNTFVGDRDVAILLQFSNICCNTQTFVGQRDVAICNAQKFLSLNFRKWKVVLKPGLIDDEENVSKIVNFIRPEDLGWKYLRKSLAWESIYMELSSGGRLAVLKTLLGEGDGLAVRTFSREFSQSGISHFRLSIEYDCIR